MQHQETRAHPRYFHHESRLDRRGKVDSPGESLKLLKGREDNIPKDKKQHHIMQTNKQTTLFAKHLIELSSTAVVCKSANSAGASLRIRTGYRRGSPRAAPLALLKENTALQHRHHSTSLSNPFCC